jgi:hypothetical protein
LDGRRKGRKAAARRVPLLRPRSERGQGGDYIRDYYSYFGPAADDMARSIPSSPETIEGLIRGLGDVGADEVVCWPTVAELEQVDRLAELVG